MITHQSLKPSQYLRTTVYGGIGGLILFGAIRYRGKIRERLRQVQDSYVVGGLSMVRDKTGTAPRADPTLKSLGRLPVYELNPEFGKRHPDWRFSSLGEYLGSLRPGALPKHVAQKDLPNWIQNEVEAGLAASLIQVLGPSLGRALLPALGFGPLPAVVEKVTGTIVARFMARKSESGSIEEEPDRGFLPISLLSVLAVSDTNATRYLNKKKIAPNDEKPTTELSSIEKMKQGEYGSDPSFNTTFLNSDNLLVPNPFIVSEHWEAAIQGMEERVAVKSCGQVTQMEANARNDLDPGNGDISSSEGRYDPDGREMTDPVPIDEKLFPDLYMGWGNAKCTNTNREVVRNRLLAVLLNRLASNYYDYYNTANTGEPFIVYMEGSNKPISRPYELISALVQSGHQVTVHVTSQPTTFGVALCVKEDDGGWSNIPLACFLGSGYEDEHARPAPAMLPHSGLDLDITGPLVGQGNKCNIQHYMAIEGMCGWHSNHSADVPWLGSTDCGAPVYGEEAVHAARLAGLYGVILNTVGTEMDLPFGGYGLTGVCNDTAAVMEYALHGTTQIYPLTSVGRFSMHVIRYAGGLREALAKQPSMDKEVADLNLLIESIRKLQSDLHASPANAPDAGKRMLHCLPPELPFNLMVQSKDVMESILEEHT